MNSGAGGRHRSETNVPKRQSKELVGDSGDTASNVESACPSPSLKESGEKPSSQSTRSRPKSLPHAPSKGPVRQSVHFTDKSLKVSLKRMAPMVCTPAQPFILGTDLSTTTKQIIRSSQVLTDSTSDSTISSSEHLAKFITSLTPIPVHVPPVSPKKKVSPKDKLSTASDERLPSPLDTATPHQTLSSPSVSHTALQCSITTQTRLISSPSATESQPGRQSDQQTKDESHSKPTPTSIYRQLVADKKIVPGKRKSSSGKKPSSLKKRKVSESFKMPAGEPSMKHKAVATNSPKEGLSSRLSAPLHTTFPTFVIPQMPMGGGTDPNVIVSPVWLGPSSFGSGLMPTLSAHATPTCNTGLDNTTWSLGSSLQAPSFSAGSNSHKLTSSNSVVAPQTASRQQSPFGFGNPQLGSFQSQKFPGIPLFPADLPLKSSVNPNLPLSSPENTNQAFISNSIAERTATTAASNSSQKQTTKVRGPSKQTNAATSIATNKDARNAGLSFQSSSSTAGSLDVSRPHIDMYPEDPLASSQQVKKTLPYHQPAEHPCDMGIPYAIHNTLPNTRPVPMSQPTRTPTNMPRRFHFPTVSSPTSLPSWSSGVTCAFNSRPATLKLSNSTGISPTVVSTPTSSSLATPSEVVTTSSSMGPLIQDVNSFEYRMMILKKVQQWNEQKKKILKDNAKPKTKSSSPPLLVAGDETFSSLSNDGACPVQPFNTSTNISPCSSTGVVGSLTETSGLNTLILSTSSLTTSDSQSSVTGEASTAVTSVSAPLPALRSPQPLPALSSPKPHSLGSPKLLTVGPPVTFAETLVPTLSPSLPFPHSGKDLTSMTSPTGPSVAGDATQMDDIITASFGSSIVSPSVVFNSAFIGDISAMSRWELEQLYRHNMEKLEQQKKFIKILEAQLKRICEQHTTNQNQSQSDVYKRFLSFVVEPELVPDVSIVTSNKFGYGHLLSGAKAAPPLDFNEIIKGGTFDRPVMNKKYDFYANFAHS